MHCRGHMCWCHYRSNRFARYRRRSCSGSGCADKGSADGADGADGARVDNVCAETEEYSSIHTCRNNMRRRNKKGCNIAFDA
jgi:hypothetical protein